MAKKVLSVVLAVIMLMSVLVVGTNAATDWKVKVDRLILFELLRPDFKDSKVQEYVTRDPDVIERNLYFWKDEIIDGYHAAQTQEDWHNLYNQMTAEYMTDPNTGDELDWYPAALDKQNKEIVNVKYETDVAYAKPGDIITVTVSVQANFYILYMDGGIMYDKTLLTLVPGSLSLIPVFGRIEGTSPNDHFGITDLGTNNKHLYWPYPYRLNQNGEFDRYNIIKCYDEYDVSIVKEYVDGKYVPFSILYEDYTPYLTAQFVVNEGVADGTPLEFFAPARAGHTLLDLQHTDSYGMEISMWTACRTLGPDFMAMEGPDDITMTDHKWNFENATVMVGEEPAAEVPADYTALDAAIDAFDDTVAADFTDATWQAYADAVAAGEALSRDYLEEDQAIVDAAATAITDAFAALEKNAIISAGVFGEPVIGTNAYVNVNVTGSPEFLRFDGDVTRIYNREDATIVENNDGTETWTVSVLAETAETSYDIFAKYVSLTEEPYALTINAVEGVDLTIHSIVIPDMYPDQASGGRIQKGRHDIIIKTSTDVDRIQFVTEGGSVAAGNTYTYMTSYTPYVDEDGVRTWTISHAFGPLGTWTMPIRTRGVDTTYSYTGATLTATVLY